MDHPQPSIPLQKLIVAHVQRPAQRSFCKEITEATLLPSCSWSGPSSPLHSCLSCRLPAPHRVCFCLRQGSPLWEMMFSWEVPAVSRELSASHMLMRKLFIREPVSHGDGDIGNLVNVLLLRRAHGSCALLSVETWRRVVTGDWRRVATSTGPPRHWTCGISADFCTSESQAPVMHHNGQVHHLILETAPVVSQQSSGFSGWSAPVSA